MSAIEAQFTSLPAGGILYDVARVRHPGAQLFQRQYWQDRHAIQEVSGGRATVSFIVPGDHSPRPDDRWVWRHYRRGGLLARALHDRYLFTGAQRTRCFREWHLLALMTASGLPVPAPIAACFYRCGLTYGADLLTAQLPASVTLAQSIVNAGLPSQQWQSIGKTLAAFHARGVHHADLNAHNILLGSEPAEQVFLLDFDRGRIQRRGAWEAAVLARLHRSLQKVATLTPGAQFDTRCWQSLLLGYRQAL